MRNKDKNCIWKVTLTKAGKKKVFKELYFIGEHLLQVSHIAYYYIYGESRDEAMFDFDVDIKDVCKVDGIDDIVNYSSDMDDEDDMEYDPEMPYELLKNKSFPADEVIKFKCDCKNDVIVANVNWPYIQCKSCKRQILHRDLELVSGMWLYHPSN